LIACVALAIFILNPMLIINGQFHPFFIEGSANLNVKSVAGILPDNKLVFAISKKEISF
jgi:uncharacterized protein YigE (DUF2233 family)